MPDERVSWTERGLALRIRAERLLLRRGAPLTLGLVALRRASVARRQRLIAVTGSQGKTTTVRAVRCALGLPESDFAEASRNMMASTAWGILCQSPWARHAVVELGASGPGSLGRKMRQFVPHVAVITSFGTEHHRAFASVDALREEKASVARLLSPSGRLVLNADDAVVAAMAGETRAPVATFGTAPGAGLRATSVRLDWPNGTVVEGVSRRGEPFLVRSRLFGIGGVQAVLAALAVADLEGVPLALASNRLETLRPTLRRLQPYTLANGAVAIVDEAKAPPEGMAVFLDFARQLGAPIRRTFVLGALDPDPVGDEGYYRRTASEVAALAEAVVVVGAPEVQGAYANAFAEAGMDAGRLTYASDVVAARAALPRDLGPGAAVFIKATGKPRLGRIAIAASGRPVGCRRLSCAYEQVYCERCPLLAKRP
ncbi:MAG: Mur ligase family protein [Dehalococcoidia bacterium]